VREENPSLRNRVYEAPWLAGIRAARANLLPGLILQGVMILLVVGYYFVPATHGIFDLLAMWKEKWGYAYSAISAMIAGAVIPEALRVFLFQRGKSTRRNAGNFLFAAVFWGVCGMQVDLFYRLQAIWFGSEATPGVVILKVLVDQFLYCPIIAGPQTAFLYDWKQTGFAMGRLREFFTFDFYRRAVVPTLFATWGVWIPVVAALYSLPSLLQIPLFALALSLWVILFTWMSEQRAKETA
jgi:uncharacterized membrane protein